MGHVWIRSDMGHVWIRADMGHVWIKADMGHVYGSYEVRLVSDRVDMGCDNPPGSCPRKWDAPMSGISPMAWCRDQHDGVSAGTSTMA